MSRFPEAIKRTRHTTRDLISLTLMLLVSLHTGLQQAGMGELTGSPTVPTVHFLTSNTGPNSFNEYSPYSTFQTFWVLGLCSEHKSMHARHMFKQTFNWGQTSSSLGPAHTRGCLEQMMPSSRDWLLKLWFLGVY